MDWKEQPVFISSTFNDMHAERDYLMKNVFPQLGEWCERRHIILRDIDLRWGVPPTVVDDPDSQNTIYKCLKAVDRSRPFFLCLLGQRRGWVPTPDRISPLTLETFRELADMVRTGSHSATEYEIEHALLMPLACFENGVMHREEPVRCALFLRRRPDYLSRLTPSQKKVFLDYDEALCAARAAAYLAAMGPGGLRPAAAQCAATAHYLQRELEKAGLAPVFPEQAFFHEFVTECPDADRLLAALRAEGILGGLPRGGNRMLWCATEMNTREEMDRVAAAAREVFAS